MPTSSKEIAVGSKCLCIEDGKTYILNNNREWAQFDEKDDDAEPSGDVVGVPVTINNSTDRNVTILEDTTAGYVKMGDNYVRTISNPSFILPSFDDEVNEYVYALRVTANSDSYNVVVNGDTLTYTSGFGAGYKYVHSGENYPEPITISISSKE